MKTKYLIDKVLVVIVLCVIVLLLPKQMLTILILDCVVLFRIYSTHKKKYRFCRMVIRDRFEFRIHLRRYRCRLKVSTSADFNFHPVVEYLLNIWMAVVIIITLPVLLPFIVVDGLLYTREVICKKRGHQYQYVTSSPNQSL